MWYCTKLAVEKFAYNLADNPAVCALRCCRYKTSARCTAADSNRISEPNKTKQAHRHWHERGNLGRRKRGADVAPPPDTAQTFACCRCRVSTYKSRTRTRKLEAGSQLRVVRLGSLLQHSSAAVRTTYQLGVFVARWAVGL